jgi:hypothetical protein
MSISSNVTPSRSCAARPGSQSADRPAGQLALAIGVELDGATDDAGIGLLISIGQLHCRDQRGGPALATPP